MHLHPILDTQKSDFKYTPEVPDPSLALALLLQEKSCLIKKWFLFTLLLFIEKKILIPATYEYIFTVNI